MLRKSLKSIAVAVLAAFVLAGCSQAAKPLVYPKTAKVDQVDDYFGVKVADPYRWLEELDSPQTKAWVEAENKVTFAYLKEIPAREKIKNRLTKLWNYEKYGVPEKEDGRYFFAKNDGLQNQSVVYTVKSLDEQPRVLIDPNLLSKDGTVALAGYSISDDGKLMAYGVSGAGSDWEIYHVRDVETAQDMPDEIKWVKFSGASWTKDNKGFFYSRYDEPKTGEELKGLNYYHKLYYHKLGATQDQDQLIYDRPDQKEWEFAGYVTEDGRYLIITIFKGTARETRVSYKDLKAPDSKVVDLLTDFDAQYGFIGNDGPVFWFQTDFNAPRRRVIAIDTAKPDRAAWKEIIPQTTETLEGVSVVNDMFICSYLKDAYTQVKIHDLSGKPVRDVKFPCIGTAGGFGGKRKDKETFYSFTSFSYPTTVYRYDMVTGESTVFKRPTVDFNSDEYETKQVFYTSKDGTKVPMFIVYKKGLKLDGSNPTLLYGYGGFDVSLTPSFSISRAVWMEMGGVYAMANLRGGGEYGKAWHDAGRLVNKQNCFDDFIAAAEWLIANKYTKKDKLAVLGGSNGGLLIGAVETQRPDLFGACLPAVGVMDMLRFKRFTCGWEWVSDYGDVDTPEGFKVLNAYSPLQNIKPGTKYPATMITTADHDDRVVPLHSFKFAAALQAAQAGPAPILIRIETRAGHGAGKPTWMIIEEQADQWAFLVRVLGMDQSKIKS
ncbi:MAG TPA: prolyl oligopeptidase family serine peptidase [Phycisphaerae bacterium]|nr:prolyl oligopeptidase family serine peptidase [Phycisphaerae bacterium]